MASGAGGGWRVGRGVRWCVAVAGFGVAFGSGTAVMQKAEPAPNANWNGTSPLPGVLDPDYYIAVWTGTVTAPATGDYLFGSSNDDAIGVQVGGQDAYTAACCSAAVQTWKGVWNSVKKSVKKFVNSKVGKFVNGVLNACSYIPGVVGGACGAAKAGLTCIAGTRKQCAAEVAGTVAALVGGKGASKFAQQAFKKPQNLPPSLYKTTLTATRPSRAVRNGIAAYGWSHGVVAGLAASGAVSNSKLF